MTRNFKILAISILFASLALFSCGKNAKTTPYDFNIPAGYPTPIDPTYNPTTVEGVALGRKLFYDKNLSANKSLSCASCHKQEHGFTDNAQFSTGIHGQTGVRNSMVLINLAYNPYQRFFWDGRANTLEEQIFEPVRNPIEMGNNWNNVVAYLKSDKAYVNMFEDAFGTRKIDSTLTSKAIAQFLRTLISFNSKFDKYVRGEVNFTP